MSKECRSVVVSGKLKRTGYRGVVDIVYGGEKPALEKKHDGDNGKNKGRDGRLQRKQGHKRKAEEAEMGPVDVTEKPLSKRAAKRAAKEARLRTAPSDGTAMDWEDSQSSVAKTRIGG